MRSYAIQDTQNIRVRNQIIPTIFKDPASRNTPAKNKEKRRKDSANNQFETLRRFFHDGIVARKAGVQPSTSLGQEIVGERKVPPRSAILRASAERVLEDHDAYSRSGQNLSGHEKAS